MQERKKRGQSGLEYIVLVGIVLVVLIPLIYYSTSTSSEAIKQSQGEDMVWSLANAADEVYVLSPGTKKYVWINVPGNIQDFQINSTEISVTFSGFGDIVAATKATVVGKIPIARGRYKIPIELLASGIVRIGEGNDSTPPIITWKDPTGLVCNPITLRATTDEPALCKFDTIDGDFSSMVFTMNGNSLGHDYYQGFQLDGGHQYFVRCIDLFNNEMNSSDIINYTIDSNICGGAPVGEIDPPNVTLINPPNDFFSSTSNVTFHYNVTDESEIFTCKLFANESLITTIYEPPRNVENEIAGIFAQGYYEWLINCTDAFSNNGNSSTRTMYVDEVLDVDLPIVNLISPPNNSLVHLNLISFIYNVTDLTSDVDACTLSLHGLIDNGPAVSQSVTDQSIFENQNETISMGLEQGNYTWNVSCVDDSINQNIGLSETWFLRVNRTLEEAFIESCPGQCGLSGFQGGLCRQSPSKCTQSNQFHHPPGDQYCTSGAQSDTCCCDNP
jgi:uncharacterized protein (UPF0333 family)